MRGISKLLIISLLFVSIVMINIGFSNKQLAASEVNSEVDSNQVIDLSGMSQDQIAEVLDEDEKTQDFIVLDKDQLTALRGYKVTEIIAAEDFSKVNSSMYGEYGIYKINGHYVFCIEPGYDTLNSAQLVEPSGSIYNKFKANSKLYISRVISSSIEHYNQTSNEKYIFAGQLLIWDYVSNNEAATIGNAMESWNPEYLNSWTINNSIYLDQIKVIESDLSEWNTLPSFLGSSTNPKQYTLDYDQSKKQFSIVLVDSNGVWDRKYESYGNFGEYTLSNPAGKNNLKVTSQSQNLKYSQSKKFTWSPTISGTSELYDAGQDLIYVGAAPKSGYIKFKTAEYPKGGFKLTKFGEQVEGTNQPLAGVKFEVTSKSNTSFDQVYTTNSQGVINSTKTLVPGNYHIKEISAPTEYVVNYQQDFIVQPGQITELNEGNPVINNLYYNRIHLEKVGENFDNVATQVIPLAEVEFDLYQELEEPNDIIDESDILLDTLVSDQNGMIDSGRLYQGNYILEEKSTNSGYILDLNPISFEVKNDGSLKTDSVIDLGVIENKVISGQVELSKLGVGSCKLAADCGVPLDQVTFDIYHDINNNLELDENELEAVDQIITDSDGYGISKSLKYGHYFIQETTSSHDNYQINNRVYDFTIETNHQVAEINDGHPIENSEKLGKIEIYKSGKSLANDNQEIQKLSGAEYSIIDTDGNLVDTIVTDAEGYGAATELSFGQYQLIEAIAPVGYKLNPQVIDFKINQETYQQYQTFEVSDEVITNRIEISKIDSANEQELPGAEIEVRDLSTDQVVEKWTSTDKAHVFDINYGEYQICETTAPAGFKKLTSCTDFEVTEDGVTQSFTLVNKRMKMAITGATSKRTWILILLVMIVILLVSLYARIYVSKM